MKQKSDWKRITLLRKTSFKKEIKNIGRLLPTIHPESCRELVTGPDRRLLTNPDLFSHTINQLLGIVADPCLEDCLDVLDLVNAF